MSFSGKDLGEAMLRHIKLELQAAHNYKTLSYVCAHPKLALDGFSKYFLSQAEEELKHADAFIKHHMKRGGNYICPSLDSFQPSQNVTDFFTQAYEMEDNVLSSLGDLHQMVDIETQIFIEYYIQHQTDALAELKTLDTKLKRVSDSGTGLYLLDRELM